MKINVANCNFVAVAGLLIEKSNVKVVVPNDLTNPQRTNTCIAGTIGIHLFPKNIIVKSGANMKISPAIGKDKNAMNCKTLI